MPLNVLQRHFLRCSAENNPTSLRFVALRTALMRLEVAAVQGLFYSSCEMNLFFEVVVSVRLSSGHWSHQPPPRRTYSSEAVKL